MKKLKKLAALLLALSMVFALAACSNQAATPSTEPSKAPESAAPADPTQPDASEPAAPEFTTVEPGKLHMSTNAAFPPYEMTTDAGGFEGIDVEVADAIAKKLGLELVVDDMDFTAALTAVQNGQSDIAMAAITVKPDRLEVMDFSDTYAVGIQVIIVNEGSDIKTVDDLANAQMIGTQAGTTGYDYCSGDYGDDHVTAFNTGALAVTALVNGQVDAVVIDNEPAKSYVANNPGLVILPAEYSNEDYAIGFAKGNTALKDAVNQAIAELKADGTFQSIVDKYIKAD